MNFITCVLSLSPSKYPHASFSLYRNWYNKVPPLVIIVMVCSPKFGSKNKNGEELSLSYWITVGEQHSQFTLRQHFSPFLSSGVQHRVAMPF